MGRLRRRGSPGTGRSGSRAKVTWEAIQRIELCDGLPKIFDIVAATARALGCDSLKMACHRDGRTVLAREMDGDDAAAMAGPGDAAVSGPTATFRLCSGQDLLLTVALHQAATSPLAADIAFRFLQRLALATAERAERLLVVGSGLDAGAPGQHDEVESSAPDREGDALAVGTASPGLTPAVALDTGGASMAWFRRALGGEAAPWPAGRR